MHSFGSSKAHGQEHGGQSDYHDLTASAFQSTPQKASSLRKKIGCPREDKLNGSINGPLKVIREEQLNRTCEQRQKPCWAERAQPYEDYCLPRLRNA